ncbi:MAG TPA: 3'(2'),5'-bisphosphate nucleotidase CysQ [Acidimicrobiales bacterium]|nr:3'(2'),5'-bisphosphate nucleotidase CysQ [Acidimicrobiales bacterium]
MTASSSGAADDQLTPDDHVSAADMAALAADTLMTVRSEVGFSDAAALRSAGDRRSEETLQALLAERHPDDAVLSEESPDNPERLRAERVWVIDPLDGTREFAEAGRSDFAVHVALVVGDRPRCGAVALPATGEVFSTALVPLIDPVEAAPGRRLRLAVSRSRPPEMVGAVAAGLDAELVPMGSAGVKIMAVVRGEVDLYVHAGGQYEWDSAAPVAVALAAGLHASRIDGSELRYNQADPWLPDLVVCRAVLAERVLEVLASVCGAVPSDAPGA